VTTTSQSPGGGPASASTKAGLGSGVPGGLITIQSGQSAAYAAMTPGGGYAVGAISAGYGGSGEPLTYTAKADFAFATTAPEELYLTLLDNNHTGGGFDSLELKIDVNGSDYLTLDTDSLSFAAGFFSDNQLDLGALGRGNQTIDLFYTLTASEAGVGFGFTYNLAAPESSTWAMMLLGFAGLGYAGYRRARAGVPA
jgi:hypothetical protein